MEYRKFIKETLSKANKIAMENFGKVSVSVKKEDNNQVLTEVDIAIGKYLIKQVSINFPEHNIIDEEAGVIDKHSSFTWVIDPIDGTSNFANSLPNFGIMLGLLDNNKPVAGGISLPYYNEIFTAEKSKGAFCNDSQIRVTSETFLSNSLVSYCIDGHQENPELTNLECKVLSDIVLKIRNLRTSNSVFDSAMVACGKYGAIVNKTSKIWDNVAQQILIEEAGGIYTDYYGKNIDYSNPLSKANQNFTWCAGAPKLHEALQSIINK